jgi:transcriptional regulator with XRE-family HTH domain
MAKHVQGLDMLPAAVTTMLEELGQQFTVARKRRGETRKDWATRLGVSIPTLMRLEHGDPTVRVGVVATALWLIGRVEALRDLAPPASDLRALHRDVQTALAKKRMRGSKQDGLL